MSDAVCKASAELGGDSNGFTITRASDAKLTPRLEKADELLVNAGLAIAINKEIRARGWTRIEAAGRTGLTRSDISRLGKMQTDGFSQERMLDALRRLGMDVEIRIIRRADGAPGTLKVFQPK